jgi:hypothetical protein
MQISTVFNEMPPHDERKVKPGASRDRQCIRLILFSVVLGILLTYLSAWAIAVWKPNSYTTGDDPPLPSKLPLTVDKEVRGFWSKSLGQRFCMWVRVGDPESLIIWRMNIGFPWYATEVRRVTVDGVAIDWGLLGDGLEAPLRWGITGRSRTVYLPLRPILPGFLYNVIAYTTLSWLLMTLPVMLRRSLRARRGLCPRCGYQRANLARCPECGDAIRARRVTSSSI